jgi:uncharacterized protein
VSGGSVKRCTVVYAQRTEQLSWPLSLPAQASIGEALAAARRAAGARAPQVPWDSAAIGIFGELRRREERFADGDRIEIYRPLVNDPRERRRQRVQRERARR